MRTVEPVTHAVSLKKIKNPMSIPARLNDLSGLGKGERQRIDQRKLGHRRQPMPRAKFQRLVPERLRDGTVIEHVPESDMLIGRPHLPDRAEL